MSWLFMFKPIETSYLQDWKIPVFPMGQKIPFPVMGMTKASNQEVVCLHRASI